MLNILPEPSRDNPEQVKSEMESNAGFASSAIHSAVFCISFFHLTSAREKSILNIYFHLVFATSPLTECLTLLEYFNSLQKQNNFSESCEGSPRVTALMDTHSVSLGMEVYESSQDRVVVMEIVLITNKRATTFPFSLSRVGEESTGLKQELQL